MEIDYHTLLSLSLAPRQQNECEKLQFSEQTDIPIPPASGAYTKMNTSEQARVNAKFGLVFPGLQANPFGSIRLDLVSISASSTWGKGATIANEQSTHPRQFVTCALLV